MALLCKHSVCTIGLKLFSGQARWAHREVERRWRPGHWHDSGCVRVKHKRDDVFKQKHREQKEETTSFLIGIIYLSSKTTELGNGTLKMSLLQWFWNELWLSHLFLEYFTIVTILNSALSIQFTISHLQKKKKVHQKPAFLWYLAHWLGDFITLTSAVIQSL